MFQAKEGEVGVGRSDQILQSLVKQWKLPRSAKQKTVTIISPSIPLMKGQDQDPVTAGEGTEQDAGGQEATGAVQTEEKNAFACRGESERGEEWADPVCLEVEQRAAAGRSMCGVRDRKQ